MGSKKLTVNQAKNCTVIHCRAKSDPNGNPRRVYAVYLRGALLATVDEGYNGRRALDELGGTGVGALLRENEAGDLDVTPAQYRSLCKF